MLLFKREFLKYTLVFLNAWDGTQSFGHGRPAPPPTAYPAMVKGWKLGVEQGLSQIWRTVVKCRGWSENNFSTPSASLTSRRGAEGTWEASEKVWLEASVFFVIINISKVSSSKRIASEAL